MNNKGASQVLAWLVAALLVLQLVSLAFVVNVSSESTDLSSIESRLDGLEAGNSAIALQLEGLSESDDSETIVLGSYTLSRDEFEDEALEAEALRLAAESVDSRDFLRAAYQALLAENVSIDSYRDITEVRILDVDVDENEVEYSIKVFYFLDDDADETERARLTDFVVVVDDLDYDDDFEDGEVDESYFSSLSVRRIYEN